METVFIGNYIVAVDKKNRVTIPAKWKSILGNEIVMSKWYDGCLVIRSLETFHEYCKKQLQGDEKKKDVRVLRRTTLGNSQSITLDSWARFVIPQQLVKMADLSEEIVLVGVGDTIEVWNSENYSKVMDNEENELEKVSERLVKE